MDAPVVAKVAAKKHVPPRVPTHQHHLDALLHVHMNAWAIATAHVLVVVVHVDLHVLLIVLPLSDRKKVNISHK